VSDRLRKGEIEKTRRCVNCNVNVQAQLVRNITTSGISQVFWRCPLCDRFTDGSARYINHELLKRYVIIDTLPVIKDYSRGLKCCVCGSTGVEYHHWAPKHLFHGEADNWPTAYLCRSCHAKWHKLVTPHMTDKEISDD
jgi:hypothetical protein